MKLDSLSNRCCKYAYMEVPAIFETRVMLSQTLNQRLIRNFLPHMLNSTLGTERDNFKLCSTR